ncbi:hypothetical protein Q604_UNBC16507G0001, partial [human gut metagenome]
RIDFIGGIRGIKELEKRVNSDMKIAFSMYPTEVHDIMDVADIGEVMPPKSTWFEPKLRSGLFSSNVPDLASSIYHSFSISIPKVCFLDGFTGALFSDLVTIN